MKTTQSRIDDLWNELVQDVYQDWKKLQIENDHFLNALEMSGLDEELILELKDVYIEYLFGYEVFLDSEENQALINITRMGISSKSD